MLGKRHRFWWLSFGYTPMESKWCNSVVSCQPIESNLSNQFVWSHVGKCFTEEEAEVLDKWNQAWFLWVWRIIESTSIIWLWFLKMGWSRSHRGGWSSFLINLLILWDSKLAFDIARTYLFLWFRYDFFMTAIYERYTFFLNDDLFVCNFFYSDSASLASRTDLVDSLGLTWDCPHHFNFSYDRMKDLQRSTVTMFKTWQLAVFPPDLMSGNFRKQAW